MVACEDAIGIAQELGMHHLTAAGTCVAWLKQVDEKDKANPGVSNEWKHAAAESIEPMEAALYKKAMLLYDAETDRLQRVPDVRGQAMPIQWPRTCDESLWPSGGDGCQRNGY